MSKLDLMPIFSSIRLPKDVFWLHKVPHDNIKCKELTNTIKTEKYKAKSFTLFLTVSYPKHSNNGLSKKETTPLSILFFFT